MLKKIIVLQSSDGEFFEIDETIALQSETIKSHQVEDDSANNEIPLPNITSKILAIVIEYCEKHVADSDEDLKKWEADFMEKYADDKTTLFDLLQAAHYLRINNLMDIVSQTTAKMLANKSTEEIREFFGIVSDFTPEEEEVLRIENAWAFE